MGEEKKTTMKKTLGLTGVTVNAMALIAPGAFLWITFQVQASNNGGATDMWTGIVAALIVAFLTAIAFSELARRYPEAGAGGSYYFAEKAFLDRDKASHRRFARLAKFLTGWAAHLFYWVYPGVMVAMMAVPHHLYFRTIQYQHYNSRTDWNRRCVLSLYRLDCRSRNHRVDKCCDCDQRDSAGFVDWL